jgi:hypothetical protein
LDANGMEIVLTAIQTVELARCFGILYALVSMIRKVTKYEALIGLGGTAVLVPKRAADNAVDKPPLRGFSK